MRRSGVFIVNFERTSHLVFVFIVNFEQVNAGWGVPCYNSERVKALISSRNELNLNNAAILDPSINDKINDNCSYI